MVEISRDGRRICFTNSLYGAIDPQFYPGGIRGWMVKVTDVRRGRPRVRADSGDMDERFNTCPARKDVTKYVPP
jgi:hypothetical protein